ncbi:MAG TPA: hypothetical protein VK742_18625 [Candidatus Sulfotelmatobacter sp.]|nr:hypothetical protein [Candidatus Sulfotelmatobacter sp.]
MKFNRVVMLFPLVAAGCLHSVDYPLAKEDRWTGPKIQGTICVESIDDKTIYDLTKWRNEHDDKGEWRFNYRGGYNHTNLSNEVTEMVAKHLAYSGLFTKVVSGKHTNVDFILSGNLADYRTRGLINKGAEGIEAGSSGFGAIGAIVGLAATANMKTEIQTSLKLEDLMMKDKSQELLWRDSICISTDAFVYYQNTEDGQVFSQPDFLLKQAVTKIIYELGNSSLTNHTAIAH